MVQRRQRERCLFEVLLPDGHKLWPDWLRKIDTLLEDEAVIEAVVQATLEAEMSAALGAEKGERTASRLGYRSGYYTRSLITRVGTLELRVPQDREGRFSTELFERYQRAEKSLVATLVEMYVQGVSTRKVKAVTEELCGAQLFGLGDQRGGQEAGRGVEGFCRAPADRGLSLPDPGRPL